MASTVADRQLAPEHAPRKGWIDHWDPEDSTFWESTGRSIARRNLIFSIVAEHLGFSVWVLWSIVAVNLDSVGFAFTESQLFWLVAVPNLVGATLRLPYTFAVPKFGGRNWSIVSALLLLLPSLGLAWAVSNPGTSFGTMLAIAALAGVGGGNFASSMTNISWFFPEREKGWALGLNAAGGNIGVAVVQAPFVVSAVLTAGAGIHLGRAGLMWVPLALLAAFCAWRFMDNLSVARTDFASSASAARRPHTWVMSFLYIGTFGSFIGYAAAFPLLIKGQFPEVDVTAYAFLGALVGSLSRPFGGRLADRVGGARVTAAAFVVMGLGVLGVVWALSLHSFGLFLAFFMLLFLATGIGNGSTYRMIPAIFKTQSDDDKSAKRQAAAVVGIAGAIGAAGGVLVNYVFKLSLEGSKTLTPALTAFLVFYGLCLATTWWFYLRRNVFATRPSLAYAGV